MSSLHFRYNRWNEFYFYFPKTNQVGTPGIYKKSNFYFKNFNGKYKWGEDFISVCFFYQFINYWHFSSIVVFCFQFRYISKLFFNSGKAINNIWRCFFITGDCLPNVINDFASKMLFLLFEVLATFIKYPFFIFLFESDFKKWM